MRYSVVQKGRNMLEENVFSFGEVRRENYPPSKRRTAAAYCDRAATFRYKKEKERRMHRGRAIGK